jgi:hypothetical protein
MKPAAAPARAVVIVVTCSLLLLGCASSGRRFYAGDQRPLGEVAIFVTHDGVRVDGIAEAGAPRKNLVGESMIGEVLPGAYLLDLRFTFSGTYSRATSQGVSLPLRAEPGHVYYIFQEFPTMATWRPVVVDIAGDADYGSIESAAAARRIDADSPSDVRKWVKHYLDGERVPLSKTEFATKDGTQSLWR